MTPRHGGVPVVQVSVLSFIFVCLTLLAFAFRDEEILLFISQGETVATSEYALRAGLCPHLPSCFRVGDAWLGVALEWTLVQGSRLLDLLPDRYNTVALSVPAKESYLVIVSVIVTRILTLTPILVAACSAYRGFVPRLLVLVAVFMTIMGWARSNPLFSEQNFAAYDFPTIGFLFALFVLISRGATRSFAMAAGILIVGQLIFENLGIVTGVAVAVYGLATDEGREARSSVRRALGRLGGLGAVSVATLGALYLAITLIAEPPAAAETRGFVGYFTYAFDTFGRINIQEYHDIQENFVEILAYPSASGIVLGLLVAFAWRGECRDLGVIRNQFWAAFAIWIGFMCTVVIGFFLSGLYYEMGRQLVPLGAITTVVWAKGIELMAARRSMGAGHSFG
jgi:hypothetical protein